VQLGSGLRVHDTRWHCARQYAQTLLNGVVEMFYIDTSPFIRSYYKNSWAKYTGGLLEQSWEGQLRELEGHLMRSTAAWKFVVGHHPPRSNGHHGNATELMQHLEPILQRYHVQVRNAAVPFLVDGWTVFRLTKFVSSRVQAYFSGHDHDLEHLYIEELGVHYFVSGAGSDCDRGFQASIASLWQYPSSGFAAVTVSQHEMRVRFFTLGSKTDAAYSAVVRLG